MMNPSGRRRGVRATWLWLACLGLAFSGRVARADFGFALDFGLSAALPSATGQGLDYISSAGVSELAVFQVSGGLL
ncbi:MAG: hypothetical protein JWN86_420 [Planctomycetota bacterium]|nr:hypothetical protein [Planctomycetota bacterium]